MSEDGIEDDDDRTSIKFVCYGGVCVYEFKVQEVVSFACRVTTLKYFTVSTIGKGGGCYNDSRSIAI